VQAMPQVLPLASEPTVGVPAGAATGTLGTAGAAAGAVDRGAAEAGAAGTTGLVAGATGAPTGAVLAETVGAVGFATTLGLGAAPTGAVAAGAAGRIRAAFGSSFLRHSFRLRSSFRRSFSLACPKIFLRTFSATSSGIELECVFFSVTPIPGKRSMIALALTSSSRASSLIRTWLASFMRPMDHSTVKNLVGLLRPSYL